MLHDDLQPDILISAYLQGYFPMGSPEEPGVIRWYDPDPRGVIPIDGFHVSRSLARRARQGFTLQLNRDFRATMLACGNRETTWITDDIVEAYTMLHKLGFAHSAEVHAADGARVGGVYGIALGRAFFGESMYSAATDGSKMALGGLISLLGAAGFELFDTQFLTEHLASLGGCEIRKRAYKRQLRTAVSDPSLWRPEPGPYSVAALLQRMSQTS